MCIRVEYAPRQAISDPYDADRQVITLPAHFREWRVYAMSALQAVLLRLDVEQPSFSAVCWCGDPITLGPRIPIQRRHEVINLGA
ncbi:hypothetical protein [Streptomyces sp. NBC_01171]|uniref:hypothetical protein n=1 Tax=Streptomyces sp. NBC_01171 TaxID=2903757 RepID=UPI0038634974|nr:hypothetical protein OG448_15010 [Streptomyces sp. NBC_01171]